jgi:hypothetical protein
MVEKTWGVSLLLAVLQNNGRLQPAFETVRPMRRKGLRMSRLQAVSVHASLGLSTRSAFVSLRRPLRRCSLPDQQKSLAQSVFLCRKRREFVMPELDLFLRGE